MPCLVIVFVGAIKYVLDGGALLHKVLWLKNETYDVILERCYQFVNHRYPGAIIVLDGYENQLSTKDIAHQRRSRIAGKEVSFTTDMVLTTKKEEFLSNKVNKSRFLHFLAKYMQERGFVVVQAQEDADVPIVQTAIESSISSITVVIGDDTDLLVLLLCHAMQERYNIFFKNEPKKGKHGRVWDINLIQNSLGPDCCRRLLFAHAILGCDTTSRLNGLGKGLSLRKLESDTDFQKAADVFLEKNSTYEEIRAAGEIAMVLLYGGAKECDLNIHRFNTFQRKVANATTFVHPKDLPPTSNAAKYHSFRVYLQVQIWLGVNYSKHLSPENWGWTVRDRVLYPITTDLPPAPDNILKVVKCGCKGDCASMRCTCRKNGIECSSACSGCKGLNCTNCSAIEMQHDDDDLYDEINWC